MASEPVIRDDPRSDPGLGAPRPVRSSGPAWLEEPTVLHGVPYGMYVRLWKDPRNYHYRMTYYDGTLEIMSPAYLHERPSQKLGLFVRSVAMALNIPCLGTGSTTFCRGQRGLTKGKGKEPDQSFYFTHLEEIGGKGTIDLEVDPPPDLWIEFDNRGSSKGRLPVYAALGIPEVWRYRVRSGRLRFVRLDGGVYVPIDHSLALPMLTPQLALFALSRCGNDESAWANWLRPWVAAGMPTDAP
jgi:Uma2 family endonuclease